jgi:hypothetical protein
VSFRSNVGDGCLIEKHGRYCLSSEDVLVPRKILEAIRDRVITAAS